MKTGMAGPLSGGRISYLFLTVHDFPAMVTFYHETLGFELLYFEEGAFAFLRLADERGPQIALYPGREAPTGGDNHWFLVIDVEDIEATVAALSDHGVTVGAIERVPHGRAASFRDPEGNMIEVHEPAR